MRIIIGMTDARSAAVARFGPRGAASTRTEREVNLEIQDRIQRLLCKRHTDSYRVPRSGA
jgi:hypothetical protein